MSTTIFLDKYVNDILTKIYTSQALCKLLYYDDNSDPINNYPDLENPSILFTDNRNKRIYVTPFNLDIANQQKTTLTININDANLDTGNVFYKDIKMRFFVLCPYLLWQLDSVDGTSVQRPNAIIHYLLELFNRQYTIGIGKDYFSKLYNIYPNQQIGGFCLELMCKDFLTNY